MTLKSIFNKINSYAHILAYIKKFVPNFRGINSYTTYKPA
jgi:hypothetical protein